MKQQIKSEEDRPAVAVSLAGDPLASLVGIADFEPADIDDIVYGS